MKEFILFNYSRNLQSKKMILPLAPVTEKKERVKIQRVHSIPNISKL